MMNIFHHCQSGSVARVITSLEDNVKILNLSPFVNMRHRPNGSPDTLTPNPRLGPDRNYSICCYFDTVDLEQDSPSKGKLNL